MLLEPVDEENWYIYLKTAKFMVMVIWLLLLWFILHVFSYNHCLHCFDTVSFRQEGHPICKKLSDEVLVWCAFSALTGVCVGVVICLERGADCLHMVQLMPLHPKTLSSLTSFKSWLVLPFWYWLTQVVLEKWPLNWCSSSSSSNFQTKVSSEIPFRASFHGMQ